MIGRRPEPLEALADRYDGVLALPCDVTEEAAVDAAFDAAQEAWGRIDVLFNNHGVNTTDRDWADLVAGTATITDFCIPRAES